MCGWVALPTLSGLLLMSAYLLGWCGWNWNPPMNATTIIQRAKKEGIALSLNSDGTINAKGSDDVLQRWTPMIRDHKPDIIQTLQADIAAELSQLINAVCHEWEADDRAMALRLAIADWHEALICYRDLLRRMQTGEPHPYMKGNV